MTDHLHGRPVRWWTRLLDRIDERVSGPVDDDARRRGWTVTVRPGTRTHVYRDPRFDRRRLCEVCDGTGGEEARCCSPCDGTGVITAQPVGDLR